MKLTESQLRAAYEAAWDATYERPVAEGVRAALAAIDFPVAGVVNVTVHAHAEPRELTDEELRRACRWAWAQTKNSTDPRDSVRAAIRAADLIRAGRELP